MNEQVCSANKLETKTKIKHEEEDLTMLYRELSLRLMEKTNYFDYLKQKSVSLVLDKFTNCLFCVCTYKKN